MSGLNMGKNFTASVHTNDSRMELVCLASQALQMVASAFQRRWFVKLLGPQSQSLICADNPAIRIFLSDVGSLGAR
jgi:hypothetical protein